MILSLDLRGSDSKHCLQIARALHVVYGLIQRAWAAELLFDPAAAAYDAMRNIIRGKPVLCLCFYVFDYYCGHLK